MPDREARKARILALAEAEAWQELSVMLTDLHPADIAEVIREEPAEVGQRIFALMTDEEQQADVLSHLEGIAERSVIESLTNAKLSDLVEEMAPDDAADVLADLSEERSEEVLDLMETEESEEVRALLEYDEESAGGLMTPEFLSFKSTLTVGQALDAIVTMDQDEPIYNAYVVGLRGELVGVISLWDLLRMNDRSAPLMSVADQDLVSTTADTDQEEVARLMAKYDLTALPVVDAENRLVGRITFDDVQDVIEDEASEDIFRLAGSDDAELEYNSPLQAGRIRLPWLLVTLGITFFGSLILKKFMLNLTEVLALSFFVPIVMAMCGSTGMQSSTLIIRSLALNSLDGVSKPRILGREILTGAMLGIICGAIMAGWALLVISHSPEHRAMYPSIFLAITAGLALVSAMTFATVYGAFVPMLLNRFKVDPAVASGPFVTASNDIIALLIYYGTTLFMIGMYQQTVGP